MGGVVHSIEELVGHTPLMELDRFERQQQCGAHLLAKLEFFNPTGSVKDRAALSMLDAAEKAGLLSPGGTIVEQTSGNTGIGLAALYAAVKTGCKPENAGKNIVVIIPDSGMKYLSTPMYRQG